MDPEIHSPELELATSALRRFSRSYEESDRFHSDGLRTHLFGVRDSASKWRPTALVGRPGKNRCCCEVLTALRESGGATVALSEAHIAQGVAGLATLGLYVEPTSAMTAAAMSMLLEQGKIAAGDCTALILTGTGLNATQRIAELQDQAR